MVEWPECLVLHFVQLPRVLTRLEEEALHHIIYQPWVQLQYLHPHSLSSSPTGARCACRGAGVAVACLAFGVRKTPGADGCCVASWVAYAVGRAVAPASDTRATSGAVRVALRVSPNTPTGNLAFTNAD